MKKINLILAPALIVVLAGLLLTNSATAAVLTETGPLNPDWTPWPSVGGGVVEFETRLGTGTVGGDWELGHKFNGTYIDTSGQFAITNGADFNFTLTHDAASGDFTLSLAGGPSTTWVSGRPCEAVQEIWLLAKTSNAAYTSAVNALTLDSQPINESLAAADAKKYLKIYGEPFADFSLQGTMNFSWSSGTPNGSHIETLASVVFADGVSGCPTGIRMNGSYYDSIQDAYDAIPLGSPETVKMQWVEFNESLILDRDVIVILSGGYDEFFNEPSIGWTTIASAVGPAMIISNGTVIVEYIIFK